MDRLTLPKDEFKLKLELRIAEGRAILNTFIAAESLNQFNKLERGYNQWNSYNYKFLLQSFNDFLPDSYASMYGEAGVTELKQIASSQMQRTDSIVFKQNFFVDFITPKIEYLEDILAQLDFMYYVAPAPLPPPTGNKHLSPICIPP